MPLYLGHFSSSWRPCFHPTDTTLIFTNIWLVQLIYSLKTDITRHKHLFLLISTEIWYSNPVYELISRWCKAYFFAQFFMREKINDLHHPNCFWRSWMVKLYLILIYFRDLCSLTICIYNLCGLDSMHFLYHQWARKTFHEKSPIQKQHGGLHQKSFTPNLRVNSSLTSLGLSIHEQHKFVSVSFQSQIHSNYCFPQQHKIEIIIKEQHEMKIQQIELVV